MAPSVLASRDSPVHSPSIWEKYDFASFKLDQSELASFDKEVDVLRVEVKHKLTSFATDPIEKVILIDLLGRLGISYHFENDIEEELNHIHETQAIHFSEDLQDLYIVATIFRTLRQHGYTISCGVFNKFKNANNTFKESDVKGLLGLYEASYLSIHGEDILDEALAFTRTRLELLASQQNPHLAEHITNALILPYHRGVPRIEARKYISFYEKEESRDDLVLRLAKVDFNRVQLLHRQELSNGSRWHENMYDMKSNFPYARDRMVETYLWGVGVSPEPHYAPARMIVAKTVQLITVVDDTYDLYGTLEELQCFTDSAERWDMAATDMLPQYMKLLYEIQLKFYDEFIHELKEEDRSNAFSAIKDQYTPIFKAYNEEAQWRQQGHVPRYDEYMNNKRVTNCNRLLILLCFLGMGEAASSDVIEWLRHDQKIVVAVEVISRLINDIHSDKVEKEKGISSAVECYVKEHGFSVEQTVEILRKKNADEWKNINEACMRPTALPSKYMKAIVNFVRTAEEIYKQDNGYSDSFSLKDAITSLVIEKVSL